MKNKRKSARLNARLLVVALLCILIPVGLIGITWAGNSARLLTDQTIGGVEARLTQTSRSLSLMMDHVKLLYESISTSDEVEEYAGMADGAYLETETAPYKSLTRMSEYTKNKGAVRDLLMTQMSNFDAINSIYYYDVDKNVVISYRYLDSPIEKFFDLMWLQEINAAVKETVILPVRTITPAHNEQYDVLSIVYMPVIKVSREPIYIVFNLDVHKLYHQYLYDEEFDEDDVLLLVDDENKILLAGRGRRLLDVDAAQEEYGRWTVPKAQTSFQEDGSLITISQVGKMKWRLITVRSSAGLIDQLWSSSAMITGIMLLVSLLIVAVAVFLTRQTSYPARVILAENDREAVPKLPKLLQDPEMEHVENWLQESHTAMSYHFWNNAILGSIPDDTIGYRPRRTEHFLLALINVTGADELPKNRASVDRHQLMNQFREEYGEQDAEIVMMNHNTFLVLLACEEDEQNSVAGQLADRHRKFTQGIENASMLAVGGWCETLHDIKECWMRAIIMIRYQQLTGATQINYDRHAESYGSGLSLRMWELSQQFSLNLQQETWEEAQRALENIRAELKESKTNMDYLRLRHRTMYLLANTLETFFRVSSEEAAAALPQDIYNRTLTDASVDDVLDMCADLVRRMAEHGPNTAEVTENNEYVQRLQEMLEKDCGSSMSLNAAAEKLGLSSVYLGKIFKRVTGVNYVQYLTDLRMEKAKVMLQQENVRIQDVAEALGYSQPHYFSKIFKQVTGLSPSEYVKKQRQ